MVEQAAERRATASQSRELSRQFQDQFKRVVRLVRELCCRLGIREPSSPILCTTAHCLHFFNQFVDELSAEVKDLEVVIDRECRQLLEAAVTHVFAMIAHLQPSFALEHFRDHLPPAMVESLTDLVQSEVAAFVEQFGPEKKGVDAGDSDADAETEDDGDGEDAE